MYHSPTGLNQYQNQNQIPESEFSDSDSNAESFTAKAAKANLSTSDRHCFKDSNDL